MIVSNAYCNFITISHECSKCMCYYSSRRKLVVIAMINLSYFPNLDLE
jgi:hypothetical protein